MWRRFSDATDKVKYSEPEEVSMTQPGLIIVMSNSPMLPQEELVYKKKEKESGLELFMCLERNNTASRKYIIQKFTESGNLVLDACAVTFSVA